MRSRAFEYNALVSILGKPDAAPKPGRVTSITEGADRVTIRLSDPGEPNDNEPVMLIWHCDGNAPGATCAATQGSDKLWTLWKICRIHKNQFDTDFS